MNIYPCTQHLQKECRHVNWLHQAKTSVQCESEILVTSGPKIGATSHSAVKIDEDLNAILILFLLQFSDCLTITVLRYVLQVNNYIVNIEIISSFAIYVRLKSTPMKISSDPHGKNWL